MEIRKEASAGTLESSDVMVTVSPNEGGGRKIEIDSPVLKLYEEQMLSIINASLDKMGVKDAALFLKDRGAIDCVIRARVMAAVSRAAGEEYDWSLEDVKKA